MNTHRTLLARGRHLGLAALLVASLHAQTNSPPTNSPSEKPAEDDEVYKLSPFTVSASQDTGYQAASTLAGTRLNTPVKDIGASISIYTRDFLDDIGATSSSDLLVYATSMEAAGAIGNFSGATNDINDSQVNGNGPRVNPQSSSRTRGLGAPNFTRGFFNTDIATDGYNVESVTVNRGPNSILFGVGSPAGVVESTLLRPNLNQNKNKVEIRVGDNSSLRNTVDFNRVLIKKKLAVRLTALHDEERFNQRPAFEKKERVYGALTYSPFRSTVLRTNFETGRTNANRPITVLPFKSMSSYWIDAGRQGYDWTFYDDPAVNPNARTQAAGSALEGPLIGQDQINDQVLSVYSSPSATIPDMVFRSATRVTTGTAANSVRAGTFNAVLNRDTANDQMRFLVSRNIGQIPGTFFVGNLVMPGQQPGFAPAGIKMQGFTDYSAFDFQNHMIDETARQSDSFHAFNAAFEQRAWEDRIGVELAYDSQRIDRRSRNAAFSSNNGNHIFIDVNKVLPTGQMNPNYGRPFTVAYGQSTWTNNYSDRETYRATGFLKYDFKDVSPTLGKWLGRHTATALYEENAFEGISYRNRFAVDGAAARDITASINAFARRPGAAIYLGPSIIGNNNPLQLEAIRVPLIQAGPIATPASYFVRAAGTTDPGSIVASPASLVEISDGGNAQRDVIKSQAFLLQSYWLQDHLVSLIGWRRDEDFFAQRSIAFTANPSDPNDPGKVHYGFNDLDFAHTPPFNVAGETMTYSGVLRWPQKLIRLPAGTDFSVFYNQSSNFTPSGGRVNPYNEPLASPEGDTKEYGFNLSLLDNKLSLRVNWFETNVKGQSLRPAVFGQAVNNAVLQVADFWGEEGNVNPQLVAMRNADIELLFSPLPANFRSLYGWGISGTAPNLAANGRVPLSGDTDTTDFVAKGTEFEIVYNPTRSWRILANVARQETIQNNSLPFLKSFIAAMTPVWNQLRDRARNAYPVGWLPGDPLNVETFGDWLDRTILVPFATAIATEGSASAEQRKWRANLITSYSFGRGGIFGDKLKGWTIGGAVRWQDKLGIGYPSTRNADGTVNLDLAHPYYAPDETNVDAFVSYERTIWKNRIKWKVQLNARNIIADDSVIPIGVQPWGEYSTVRLPPEKRWYLTNTFTF
ncbi:MAG: TonB-dependent receptor [Opitutaceae bacterium]|nr:TonB-dependent receptor [Opitutaceae bacterium]